MPRTKRKVREQRIDGRELYVLDGVLSPSDTRALCGSIAALPFHKRERDRAGTQMRGFVADFDVERCADHLIVAALWELLATHFPGEAFDLWRMYCNNNVYGDMSHPHRDSQPPAQDVSAVFYANAHWDIEWGGETLFYDDAGDAVACVMPKPGRVALFRGAILHRNGVPSRECYEPRLTLVFKFLARPAGPTSRRRAAPRSRRSRT